MRILLAQMSEERETSQREIERDCEMTMMAFLLNSDGALTHSIMVVNSGLPSSPTQSFYPHPLHSDCGISNMSKISSSSAFFYNFRMTLRGDKGCGPPLNHAYPRGFDACASFLNDAQIPAQDSCALNAHFTRISRARVISK